MFWKKSKKTALFQVDKDLDHLIGGPQRSHKSMPDWFKKLPKNFSKNDDPPEMTLTVKGCVPFVEALSHGATFSLWCDLRVVVREYFLPTDENGDEFVPNRIMMDYPSGIIPLDKTKLHGEIIQDEQGQNRKIDSVRSAGIGSMFLFPEGFWQSNIDTHSQQQVKGFKGRYNAPPHVYKLISPWIIKTPKGYSTFFKNPCNKFDSPLTIFEGFVDTDYYENATINFPCFWNATEEGVFSIQQGTPICQMLFIKRDTELSVVTETLDKPKDDVQKSNTAQLSSRFDDRYRRMFWHKTIESKKRLK